MRNVKISDISLTNLKEESCGDHEYFEYLVAESNGCQALSYFGITYDEDKHEMNVPKNLVLVKAIETVSHYLEVVEDYDDVKHTDESKKYDDYTEPHRGADDGTFDYVGTYVITILCVLQEFFRTGERI